MSLYIEGLNIWTKNYCFDSSFSFGPNYIFLTKKNDTGFAFLTSKPKNHIFISNKEKMVVTLVYIINIKIYIFLVLLDKERRFDKERNVEILLRSCKFDIAFSC